MISDNEEHSLKVFFWIKMTNGGILTFSKISTNDAHPQKAYDSIDANEEEL